MNIELEIDNREQKLIQLLDIQFSIKQLDIGDIIIKLNNQIIIAIERKTMNDLFCSIKDGRYKEQKFRLLSLQKENIISMYIIEGVNKNQNTLSAMVNTIIRDKLYVFRTYNLQETVNTIKTIIKNIKKYIEIFNEKNLQSIDYIDHISVKKNQCNNNDIYCLQLQQIKGISSKISRCIYDSFPNWKILINELTIDKLKNLEYEIKNNKKRKIGPVIANRLYDFIHQSSDKSELSDDS